MSKPLVIAALAAAILAILWAGCLVQPRPFPLRHASPGERPTIPLPAGLPSPVERFYRARFAEGGGSVPRIDSAVFSGRGRMRPFGLWLPMRFIFVHKPGEGYRHYIEATWFGIPFLKVNEGIVDGKSFFESPMGSTHDDPNTNQGANLALWAEALWFPSIWLGDPRVRWQAVDDSTALLSVPYGEARETFVARFDPATGLMDSMEAMRYREPGQGKPKILWIARDVRLHVRSGAKPDVGLSPFAVGTATWMDQGSPWARFNLEKAAWNFGAEEEVEAYLRARGR